MHNQMGQGNKHLGVPPGETAPRSSSLTGGYEGIATAKPPLVKEITVRLPKSKSLTQQGALEPTKDNQKTKDLTNTCARDPYHQEQGGPNRASDAQGAYV